MNLTAHLLHSELAQKLSPDQKRGLQIEISTFNAFSRLEDSPHPLIFRGSAENCSEQQNSEAFYFIEDTWSNFLKFRSSLLQKHPSRLALLINRSYPLLDDSLSSEILNGFRLHFPICELETDPYYLLDEIFLFLQRVGRSVQGPGFYQVFNPAWKTQSPKTLQMESRFHSSLHPDDYLKAFSESPHLCFWRKRLASSSKLTHFFIDFFLNPQRRPLDSQWERSGLKYLWQKWIYWPLEYHWKTWKTPLSAEEYEKAQSQKIAVRRERNTRI